MDALSPDVVSALILAGGFVTAAIGIRSSDVVLSLVGIAIVVLAIISF